MNRFGMTAIHPSQPAGDLSPDQITKLLANLKRIFKISLAAGGSSSRNYVNAQGQKGRYLDFAKAYAEQASPVGAVGYHWSRLGSPIGGAVYVQTVRCSDDHHSQWR